MNPGTFSTNYYMDSQYYNLWDANNNVNTPNDNLVVKTIYDPCPAGYKLPPSNFYIGFTTTGERTHSYNVFNVQGAWAKGWHFYCGLNHTGDTAFFPALGYRYSNSAVLCGVGSSCYYWTAGSHNTTSGWGPGFFESYMDPLNPNAYRSYGFVVRATQE